ncbi:MAG: hypothetical protein ACJ0F8_04015 [Gammaproteobacteria bacterium]|uniref:Holliday junction resolvase n=1 Tax=SAR86 cluster bacterium TaxID=2030880 RepID=A0A520N1L0_9GAMM|nr:hypothetical protein [Gammaproteobacteria bacterium]MBA4729549.1 hypothetical protein [SAR86 cluster bacterium]RPG34880.1 MAG: hypothetical protein CBD53_001320 [Gammaproteobacteria bacterium TMED193]RZO27306.1 MAG: hypothetical protein EVA92_00755 [SAR86 cluster bacterium]|tara:strand:- start:3770 stop:4177 length:408 start_codon:yes stop_codon:yes gene_type:complete
MTINQRKKGHDFERKIAKNLQIDLGLKKPVRRILSQYQEKNHPDLKIGRWNIECKAYKKGFEPLTAWWEQVKGVTSVNDFPALVYKFDNKPIRVRVRMSELNGVFFDETKLVDLSWDSFCYLLKNTFQDDLEGFM